MSRIADEHPGLAARGLIMDRDIGEHHLRALIDLIDAFSLHANGRDAGSVVFGEDGLFQVVAGQRVAAGEDRSGLSGDHQSQRGKKRRRSGR